MKPSFRSNDFIFTPTAMAAPLAALTQKPMIFSRQPKATRDGRLLSIKATTPGAFGRSR